MILYNLNHPDNDGLQNFVTRDWQSSSTSEFCAKYQSGHVCVETQLHDSGLESETVIADDDAIAEAYAKGFLDGKAEIAAQRDDKLTQSNRLADAIGNLGQMENGKLTDLLWKAVRHIVQEAIGQNSVDKEALIKRCEEAASSIEQNIGEAILYVAPADVELLNKHNMEMKIIADNDLLPGSVKLVHRDGEYISGTAASSIAIDEKLDIEGQPKC
ncbi:hypothetical protein MNBD_ALPHA04-489 [hydrothermal vent metagenome]|uniref:Flagellar assembly protein FliH/Type III secretion system HrpE domain-containing protein n=1 Tax=hydrothermal vent metagenome TaxID=652676 RepID=A0A3B0SA28_9ZZZZ